MERTKKPKTLTEQVKEKSEEPFTEIEINKGNFDQVISTGSTLLDLIISGGRVRGGGLPGGIFVEIYGPESSGKTAIICEIGGNIQKAGGEAQYLDPEGRIDAQHAQMFGITIDSRNYSKPNTVPEVFEPIDTWKPKGSGIHGILVDSLAALSTDIEMKEGDKMGGRRAKEFSQELRVACRKIKDKNYLMVCSNQLRDTFAMFGKKQDSPGGQAIRFYSSLRLETNIKKTIVKEKEFNGIKFSRNIGVEIEVKVVKSSVWEPMNVAPVIIIWKYGIDDIRANLQFIKDWTGGTVYSLDGDSLSNNMDKAIAIIEKDNLESLLKDEVIDLWELREKQFLQNRKPKI
jgi:recombination protein RecA